MSLLLILLVLSCFPLGIIAALVVSEHPTPIPVRGTLHPYPCEHRNPQSTRLGPARGRS